VDGGNSLPRAGYLTICVTEEVYKYVQTRAKETNRSIPEYIKHLIELEKAQAKQL
jgi:predicted CopG family antitoxin